MELGETVAQALVREVAEETGLLVEPVRLLGYKDAISRDGSGRVRYHYVILFYLARPVGGELRAGDDAAAAAWVPLANLGRYPLTDSVAECLRWAGLAASGPEAGQP